MRGANAALEIRRMARDGTTTTPYAALAVRIQPHALDVEPNPTGPIHTAVLTCAAGTDLRREDTFTWHGQPWQITATNRVDGRGGYVRAHANYIEQSAGR